MITVTDAYAKTVQHAFNDATRTTTTTSPMGKTTTATYRGHGQIASAVDALGHTATATATTTLAS